MNSTEFKALTIEEQVNYINEGESLSSVCKTLGISKSISSKLKAYHYKLINGKYTLSTPSHITSKPQEVAIDIITLPKVKTVKKVQNKPKIGRPLKEFATTKLTLEVRKDVVRKLKHYCIDNEIYMNKYIEELLIKNLK